MHAPLSRLLTVLAQIRVPVAFATRPVTIALLRKPITSKLRQIINVPSPGGLTWSVGMMLISDTACLTDLGC